MVTTNLNCGFFQSHIRTNRGVCFFVVSIRPSEWSHFLCELLARHFSFYQGVPIIKKRKGKILRKFFALRFSYIFFSMGTVVWYIGSR